MTDDHTDTQRDDLHSRHGIEVPNQDPGPAGGPPPNDNGHPVNESDRGLSDMSGKARGKRAVSSRKIEANQRNSWNATGPKTAAGKKRVSMNAIKHGFFSKFLLVQHADGKESQGEFDVFYGKVRNHYQPVGWLEEFRVEEIAVWSWRLRRLIRCESGQIAKALAEHGHNLQLSKADDVIDPTSASSRSPEMDGMTDHLFMPQKEELDKLLRYEARINRQLDHAISELERLQARRKGGPTTAQGFAEQSQEGL